jgi:hypothetical protein
VSNSLAGKLNTFFAGGCAMDEEPVALAIAIDGPMCFILAANQYEHKN